MRKILYSPNYGAGWVSWHSGSVDQKRFMLEYPGFVEALERQQKHDDEGDEFARPPRWGCARDVEISTARIEAALNTHEVVSTQLPHVHLSAEELLSWPYEIVLALPKFLSDWQMAFPNVPPPYLGGLRDLEIYETSLRGLVRITDYDGFEKIGEKYEDDDWF